MSQSIQNNKFILNFPNGKLDLRTIHFKETMEQDKINVNSMQISVKYEEKNDIKMEFLRKEVINKIFKKENERNVHLKFDAKMLGGLITKEMMINFAGVGKSLWTHFLRKIMGTYAIQLPSSLISERCEIETIDLELLQSVKEKRFLLFEDVQTMDLDLLKMYYDNDCFLEAKCQINCTKLPVMLGNEESLKTVTLVPFGAQISITIDADILSDEFIEEYGIQLIHILLEYFDEE